MKKNSKYLILIAGLLIISFCVNLSIGSQVYASKVRPKGMAITAKGWGMKSIDVFMDKRRAIKYSYKLEHNPSIKVQTGKYILSIAVGLANAEAGGILGFSNYLDGIAKTSEAHHIRKIVKHHKGVSFQAIKADNFQPGGKYIGSWNGKASSARKFAKGGGFSIKKIVSSI